MQSTRKTIFTYIRDQGHTTIRMISEALGLAIPTVRHHVMVLEKDGMIEGVEVRDGVGRPSLRFSLTQNGHESFPKKYDWLSNSFLTAIRTDLGEDGLKQLINTISHQTIAKHEPSITGKSLDERVKILQDLLRLEGYVTRWEQDNDGYEITFINCPFRAVSSENLEICQLDRDIIAGVLDRPVRQAECIGKGDLNCTFNIQNKVALET